VNEILEKARSCFEAHGFSREEMKEIIPRLFRLSPDEDNGQ
jgi:hypothetical protein